MLLFCSLYLCLGLGLSLGIGFAYRACGVHVRLIFKSPRDDHMVKKKLCLNKILFLGGIILLLRFVHP